MFSRMKLVRKATVWIPTAPGVFLLFLLLILLGLGVSQKLYPFLALSRPLANPSLIIIEGWIGDAELELVYKQAEPGVLLVTTGGPVTYGHSLLKEKTYADVTAARLRLLGASDEAILAVPTEEVSRDRTYASAVEVRRALQARGLFGQPANLYSLGAHSRRSYFLYRHALGPNLPLGVVSMDDTEYDLRRWWRSSHAFKHVMSESLSWIYTQCTFWKYD